jgi:signal transduction histidine kinase
MTNFTLGSIGALIVASGAVFLGIFQAIMSVRRKSDAANALGFAASFIVLVHSCSVFMQFNLGETQLNYTCELIQISCFVALIYICYRLSLYYLKLEQDRIAMGLAVLTFILLGIIWFTDLVFEKAFIHRQFLWLSHAYVESPPTALGKIIWVYIGGFALYIFRIWRKNRDNAGVEAKIFMYGFSILTFACAHDLVVTFGVTSFLYLNIYGFFVFLAAIVAISSFKYNTMYNQMVKSANALALAKEELEVKVRERTRKLTEGNQKLQAVNRRLQESETQIGILSEQTAQFGRTAASMLMIEDKQDFFDTVSAAIIKHSDYKRVLISLFKPNHPYREIIGYGGVDPDTVDRLRSVEMPAEQYDHVFETGIKIGSQSFYVPHTMKDILKQEATLYGESEPIQKENAWHPEDNLFVKMINEKGDFIGVISVDESKSGLRPTDETVRPLEIFSSLISQIILLKKEQERSLALEEQLMTVRRMESIGRLTGGIAHDFNNILGVIMGNAELLMEKMSKSEDMYSDIESIHFAGNKASEIVNQLLSFGKSAKMKLLPVQTGLMLKDLLRLLKSTVPATITIETDFQDMESVIMADQVQLNQVFLNLCLNASQSMENQAGTILLKSQLFNIGEQDAQRFPEHEPGRHLKLSVIDNGPGIETAILDKIFDPYFTTKAVGKGSGIGLSVVHGIVKSHGGSISVSSQIGKGACFDMLFPIADQEPEIITHKESPFDPGGQESVLVVDDDVMILDITEKILKQLQYRVTPVSTPEKALELFKNDPERFDLLITDMTMPNMSGTDLMKKIVEIKPGLPVILCTGYNDVVNGKTARDLNVSALLMKPVRLKELARELKAAFGKTSG